MISLLPEHQQIKVRHPKRIVALLLVVVCIAVFSLIFVVAQRSGNPEQQIRPRRAGSIGDEIVVRPGASLQSAVSSARFGDTIILEAGATYPGPLILPFKAGGTGSDNDYITIRTSNIIGIANEGDRIKPEIHARFMPKIVSPNERAAIGTEPQAHHYRFVGIEFSPASNANYVYNLIDLGSSEYSSYSQFPNHLVFDRCYVHSTGMNKARRGFALNSAETSVLNSYVSGFVGAGDETQAIAGWNGPGPFHIVNNYLEGGAEILLFGGADPSVPNLVPSDIEIRRNYLHRPKEWENRATIKGTFELKNARRVVVDGNLIESEIRTTAIVITTRNQNGKAPWSIIEDIEVTNNIVRHASTGINFLGSDNEHSSQEARRIRIANNLLVDIVSVRAGDTAYFLQLNGGNTLTVEHNTVQQEGNIISAYGNPTRNFVLRDNIVQFSQYGIACFTPGAECPRENLFCRCIPGGVIKGNVIVDNVGAAGSDSTETKYPSGNMFTPSYDKIGFIDFRQGNWRLAPNSNYRRKGTDGRDPGVDIDALAASGVNSAAEGSGFRRR